MPSRRQSIAEDLRRQIAAGHFKAGERLPSEAQLAAHYTVSTPTLRNALALLQGEGLVEKIHGSGNFVRHPRRRTTYTGGRPSAWTTPSAPLKSTVHARHLQARDPLTTLLSVAPGTSLTEILCITHEDRSPHSLSRIYIPRDLMPAGLPTPAEVAAHLTDPRPPLTEVRETACSRLPTQEEASTLRISTSLAVLSITRVAIDTTGRVVEAALLVYPGDRADALFITSHPTEERTPRP
ncbi:GntR family transcriptional regulator [Streptomyces sp. WAC07149]|uniref:GntR family transcriptional regulator n=1 Tax=Streptomyces sp. WAC07149 TaxID=2487425 RepID=UPI000F7B3F7D|nr:GntR family transcriptional regulator [Streptomyces sp. WAC07149]RST07233.1 GntR family transcriptional regulator [Streptomyces sp. WAC07149]